MRRSTFFVACLTAASLSLLTSTSASARDGRYNAFAMGAVAGAVLAPLIAAPRVVYGEPAVVYREPVVVHRAPRVVYEEVYEEPVTYYRERRYYERAPLTRDYYSGHRHHRDYFDD